MREATQREPERMRSGRRRAPRLGAVASAMVWALAAAGCAGSGESEGMGEGGAEHAAMMMRDSRASLQADLAAVAKKPAVITLAEVAGATSADAMLQRKLSEPVAALNAQLVQLAELHRTYDNTANSARRQAADSVAYHLHMKADTYDNDIRNLLSADSYQRFHVYLEDRITRAGLPKDDGHGAGTGTAGNLGGIGHSSGPSHREPNAPDTRRGRRGTGGRQ